DGQPAEPVAQFEEYEIQQLFERLQSDASVDTQRLATAEWRYLPLLDGRGASPRTLHAAIGREAGFFVELMKLLYRSRSDPRERDSVVTQEQAARATHAYTLLDSWRTMPGARDDGTVDGDALMEWVRAAREQCEAIGRLEVCDTTIGKHFAHAP